MARRRRYRIYATCGGQGLHHETSLAMAAARARAIALAGHTAAIDRGHPTTPTAHVHPDLTVTTPTSQPAWAAELARILTTHGAP